MQFKNVQSNLRIAQNKLMNHIVHNSFPIQDRIPEDIYKVESNFTSFNSYVDNISFEISSKHGNIWQICFIF